MAVSTDVAEAVVTHLSAQPFLSGDQVTREVFGVFDVEKITDRVIRVFTGPRTVRPWARCGGKDKTHAVYVTVSKKVNYLQRIAEVDALDELVEQIENALVTQPMAGLSPMTADASVLEDAQFLADVLQQNNTYHRVISLAYREYT